MAAGTSSSETMKTGLEHAPASSTVMNDARNKLCTVVRKDIPVSTTDSKRDVPAFIHIPQSHRSGQNGSIPRTGAILLSGASGGVVGPSSIYLSIADKLASLEGGILVVRLDYRYPARNSLCVSDVLAAMNYAQDGYGVNLFVLVGW